VVSVRVPNFTTGNLSQASFVKYVCTTVRINNGRFPSLFKVFERSGAVVVKMGIYTIILAQRLALLSIKDFRRQNANYSKHHLL
jgi:hypothetical protein